MITVTIPVGPSRTYRKYLQECVDSVKTQNVPPSEVLIIDDMADVRHWGIDFGCLPVKIHENPWRCGPALSFNFGVALAENELVFMLGSDDRLHPWALEDCLRARKKYRKAYGYYWCDVEYSDGETQACACNAAMVTKKLWERSGGFPPESSVGACDTILLSIMIGNGRKTGDLIHVPSELPPYWYRRHNRTVTAQSGDMQGPIFTVRDVLTRTWKRPRWPRLEGQ